MHAQSVYEIARELKKSDVRYLIVGGMAVIAHGYGRMTNDIDLVIQLEPENLIKAFAALARCGFRPNVPITPEQFAQKDLRESWIKEKHMIVLNMFSVKDHRARADVFVYEPFDFDKAFEEKTIDRLDDGTDVYFLDINRLLEMKRSAGRPQDIIDIDYLEKLKNDIS
ncbi:MAG: hypothetical protein JJU05_02455 [Verrucomicrobia bacterium]|nr:hypothetical protein [Verrucomicrobiota bacterium]MCH8526908.1 nucleotidyltransferase family protein [Kiritimatiellia bacterium]